MGYALQIRAQIAGTTWVPGTVHVSPFQIRVFVQLDSSAMVLYPIAVVVVAQSSGSMAALCCTAERLPLSLTTII